MTSGNDISDFTGQMRTVLERHRARIRASAKPVHAAACAAIGPNAALPSGSASEHRALGPALWLVLRLGPEGVPRYWRHSWLAKLILSRLHAKLTVDLA